MSEIADDEPDATILTDFVFDRNNTEQKHLKLCFDATFPRSEVVFLSQKVIILILLSFCIHINRFLLRKKKCGYKMYYLFF